MGLGRGPGPGGPGGPGLGPGGPGGPGRGPGPCLSERQDKSKPTVQLEEEP